MDITGLDKAEVLAALFNGSRQQGMGFMDSRGKLPMTIEQARNELKETKYFDYLRGRVMKISLAENNVDTWAYNRDNGQGTAENIIEELRQSKQAAAA